LYAEQAKRIVAALEFQAQYLPQNSATPPESLEFHLHPAWEIAYNHFHDRLGYSLPKMATVLPSNRPTGVNPSYELGDADARRNGRDSGFLRSRSL
jgi:hypothetical protein